MLVTIEDAELLKTRDLLARSLVELNVDNRVRFFVSRGKGVSTVQCLRVMLSRTRQAMKAKKRRYRHYKLHSHVFPNTGLDGSRLDCVILYRSRNEGHEVLETLEDLMAHGNA